VKGPARTGPYGLVLRRRSGTRLPWSQGRLWRCRAGSDTRRCGRAAYRFFLSWFLCGKSTSEPHAPRVVDHLKTRDEKSESRRTTAVSSAVLLDWTQTLLLPRRSRPTSPARDESVCSRACRDCEPRRDRRLPTCVLLSRTHRQPRPRPAVPGTCPLHADTPGNPVPVRRLPTRVRFARTARQSGPNHSRRRVSSSGGHIGSPGPDRRSPVRVRFTQTPRQPGPDHSCRRVSVWRGHVGASGSSGGPRRVSSCDGRTGNPGGTGGPRRVSVWHGHLGAPGRSGASRLVSSCDGHIGNPVPVRRPPACVHLTWTSWHLGRVFKVVSRPSIDGGDLHGRFDADGESSPPRHGAVSWKSPNRRPSRCPNRCPNRCLTY
jgi:hypothetical protein